ncbi:MAG: FIST C-terminal domain-containing protein [Nitrospinae bacterium]|nr:FIST C-terminal domain-containing protein [Nitrospinota bacterium]
MADNGRISVKKGFSLNKDSASGALAELKGMIGQPGMSLALIFCSTNYDLKELGRAIKSEFDCPVIGCTTAGEISPAGYPEWSLSGVSIASTELSVKTFLIPDVNNFGVQAAAGISRDIKASFPEKSGAEAASSFGLLLIDGLSVKEEPVVAYLSGAMGSMPIIGGSAGDNLKFKETCVYYDGEFISGAAVFSAFSTTLPVTAFKTQHFTPDNGSKMVITGAIPEKRIVTEINGRPAAQEYARFVGLTIDKLEPMIFSRNPVMLKIGGEFYVRSIQKVNDDGSLTFYCAIDEGLVLTLAKGVDIIENLEETFENVKKQIGSPKVVIGCECILRRLEILEKGLAGQAARIMTENNVIGFHTYGEQFNAVHVNQTLTGIAIGA